MLEERADSPTKAASNNQQNACTREETTANHRPPTPTTHKLVLRANTRKYA